MEMKNGRLTTPPKPVAEVPPQPLMLKKEKAPSPPSTAAAEVTTNGVAGPTAEEWLNTRLQEQDNLLADVVRACEDRQAPHAAYIVCTVQRDWFERRRRARIYWTPTDPRRGEGGKS